MPSCCAVGCTNRSTMEKKLNFYRFPKKNPKQRDLWLKAIKRLEWDESQIENARVCSEHFISGKKSGDPSDPDFVPSIFKYMKYDTSNRSQKKQRHERLLKRSKSNRESADQVEDMDVDNLDIEEPEQETTGEEGFDVTVLKAKIASMEEEIVNLKKQLAEKQQMLERTHNDSLNRLTEIQKLRRKVTASSKAIFRYKNLKSDSKMLKFYTGISHELFKWLMKYGPQDVFSSMLNSTDHLLLVLVKLRMGLTNRDLGYRFKISPPVVSRIIRKWMPLLSKFMIKNAIYWPEKMALRKSLPNCFKKLYSKCVTIIDCTEVFIERPFNLNTRAKTWSNYKNTNTIKYLIGCAPSGAINYISDGWGGRASDKEITNKCGFLNLIETGDQVLADRGFTIADELARKGGVLVIPAFTKGKDQLSANEVDKSRSISNVRIHIERVIGRMRKFNIINTTIPISQSDLLDEIMCCIGGLVNLNDRIV